MEQNQQDHQNAQPQHLCPNCGYCPHCGRSNSPYIAPYTAPYYPYYYKIGDTFPDPFKITCGGLASDTGKYTAYNVSGGEIYSTAVTY